MTRPELAGSNTTTNGASRTSPPAPFDASPAPRDAVSVVGIAMPDPAALAGMSKSKVVGVLYLFGDAVDRLLQRLNHVEGILAKNSSNSSKPPSSDQPARKPKPAPTLDAGVKRKPGGQPGHKGHALRRVANPDEVVVHAIADACDCGRPLAAVLKESRQVFDLPRPAMRVVEHQIFSATCNCGKSHRSSFPESVTAATQYGPNIQALGVYLTHHHMLPIARCADILTDLSGQSVSAATVCAMGETAAKALEPGVELIKEQVKLAAVVCADETGMRVGGGLSWLHVAVTDMLTWMGIHKNRGTAAMDDFGILGALTGTLVHDGWPAYRAYDFEHGLCNAHHLRELTYVYERFAQPWANAMIDLLLRANKEVKTAAGQALSARRQKNLRSQYDAIVSTGIAANPPEPASGKPGRTAQPVPLNLLRRLSDYADDVLRFTQDPAVPFTNNLGERTMRMLKVKQKVSGCFRTEQGARNFCITRSYLATLAKQGRDLLAALVLAMQGHPPDPTPC